MKKIKYFYMLNDPRKYHIVKIFTDGSKELCVYKFYGIHKQWWHYRIEQTKFMKNGFKIGLYTTKRQYEKK